MADEFNKYLSYVRNLGFEDTPDYDYLRDLFTQALKNTGEVEDGEYDWMKLNNGKGWEAMKSHTPQHLHAANVAANNNASQRVLGGGADTPRGPGTPALPTGRLNAPQPLPPSPVTKQGGRTRDKAGVSGTKAPEGSGRRTHGDWNSTHVNAGPISELNRQFAEQDEPTEPKFTTAGSSAANETADFRSTTNAGSENYESLLLR